MAESKFHFSLRLMIELLFSHSPREFSAYSSTSNASNASPRKCLFFLAFVRGKRRIGQQPHIRDSKVQIWGPYRINRSYSSSGNQLGQARHADLGGALDYLIEDCLTKLIVA